MIGSERIGCSPVGSLYFGGYFVPLCKNSTYQQLDHEIRVMTGTVSNMTISREHIIKLINLEIQRLSATEDKEWRHQRSSFYVNGTQNPYLIDLSLMNLNEVSNATYVQPGGTRTSIQIEGSGELEKDVALVNLSAHSIRASWNGDSMAIYFGSDFSLSPWDTIEVNMFRLPVVGTVTINNYSYVYPDIPDKRISEILSGVSNIIRTQLN